MRFPLFLLFAMVVFGEDIKPKIAFITAIYGNYEATCKRFEKQTIPVDFICFTNLENIVSNGWTIDRQPYHLTHPCSFDKPHCVNSIYKNKHTFNIAKYYKQNFQNIPRLKEYDIIVWLDGTIEITHPQVAAWVSEVIKIHPIIGWEHMRKGSLMAEVMASAAPFCDRYMTEFWFGQPQPYQDVFNQYLVYLKDGYDTNFWLAINPNKPELGVWVTCFVAFDNHNSNVSDFLNLWYKQTLNYTTQDQVGFPYVVQKTKIIPYTLPDTNVRGNSDGNIFYLKHGHGR